MNRIVAARLISGHMNATDATEIARILLNGWLFLKSVIRAAHMKASAEIYHAACAGESKLGYNKEIKDESNRAHDHKFMKCGEKNFI